MKKDLRKIKRRPRHTSELLQSVVDNHSDDSISIGELNEALQQRGFGVLLAIAALPLCLPIPAPPGYTTLFSLPIFLLASQLLVGKERPWLPKWLAEKRIKRSKLAMLVEKATPILRKIERLLKRRYSFASTGIGEKIIGLFAFIFTISIAVPLPMTNVPPAFGILFMALGMLGKDGIVIGFGMIIGTCGVMFTSALLYYGPQVIIGFFN